VLLAPIAAVVCWRIAVFKLLERGRESARRDLASELNVSSNREAADRLLQTTLALHAMHERIEDSDIVQEFYNSNSSAAASEWKYFEEFLDAVDAVKWRDISKDASFLPREQAAMDVVRSYIIVRNAIDLEQKRADDSLLQGRRAEYAESQIRVFDLFCALSVAIDPAVRIGECDVLVMPCLISTQDALSEDVFSRSELDELLESLAVLSERVPSLKATLVFMRFEQYDWALECFPSLYDEVFVPVTVHGRKRAEDAGKALILWDYPRTFREMYAKGAYEAEASRDPANFFANVALLYNSGTGPLTPYANVAVRLDEAYESTRFQASIDVLRMAVAIEIFRRDHGAYPESLAAIVNGPPTVDCFSGKSLRYTSTESGFVVYSIGSDQVDDCGLMSSKALTSDISVSVSHAAAKPRDTGQ
jgi:hypothetical protein